jgi:hypothetical protein
VDTKGAVLPGVRSLKTRAWAVALEERYKQTIHGLVGALAEQSTQTAMRLKPGSAADQGGPDTFLLALCYAAGLGVSCSKDCSSSGCAGLSRMTVLKSCHRPSSCLSTS